MVTKKYQWKAISDEGSLKEPEKEGWSNDISLNGDYGWFDSEEEAVKELEEFGKLYYVPLYLTLVTLYKVDNK